MYASQSPAVFAFAAVVKGRRRRHRSKGRGTRRDGGRLGHIIVVVVW